MNYFDKKAAAIINSFLIIVNRLNQLVNQVNKKVGKIRLAIIKWSSENELLLI